MGREQARSVARGRRSAIRPVRIERCIIPARDGFPLGATIFEPERERLGSVIIGGTVGVPAIYYDELARHLAARGFRALTFDYRGVGRSAPPTLRGFDATLRTWGANDLGGVVAHEASRRKREPLFFVGHGVAGKLLGLADGADGLTGIYLVGTEVGMLDDSRGATRWLLASFYGGLLPCLTLALGYYPGRATGYGLDLPRGVALEWSELCRAPGSTLDEIPRARTAALQCPVRVVSVEGDTYAPIISVDRLAGLYPCAELSRHHVPNEGIGHFGLFRRHTGGSLWPDLLAFLRSVAARSPDPAAARLRKLPSHKERGGQN